MIIRKIRTLKIALHPNDFPKEFFPEYAFLGRSNVGKSSLINMLLNNKNVARTSSNPGKTRTLNFYLINEQWCLVDMPGIGYAKVSEKQRIEWTKSVNTYLIKRKTLQYVFYLTDSRLPIQEIDKEILVNFGSNLIPFIIVSTKVDKTNQKELNTHINSINTFLKKHWEQKPLHIITSAVTGKGRDEILKIIEECNLLFYSQKNAKKFI